MKKKKQSAGAGVAMQGQMVPPPHTHTYTRANGSLGSVVYIEEEKKESVIKTSVRLIIQKPDSPHTRANFYHTHTHTHTISAKNDLLSWGQQVEGRESVEEKTSLLGADVMKKVLPPP